MNFLRTKKSKMQFVKLSSENERLVSDFTCISDVQGKKSKERRRIQRHDKDIEKFLKTEALKEQESKFNTTHLLIDENKLVGFVSLCCDSLKLAEKSKNRYQTIYCSVPAIKIARLGVRTEYQSRGIGRILLHYALLKACQNSQVAGAHL